MISLALGNELLVLLWTAGGDALLHTKCGSPFAGERRQADSRTVRGDRLTPCASCGTRTWVAASTATRPRMAVEAATHVMNLAISRACSQPSRAATSGRHLGWMASRTSSHFAAISSPPISLAVRTPKAQRHPGDRGRSSRRPFVPEAPPSSPRVARSSSTPGSNPTGASRGPPGIPHSPFASAIHAQHSTEAARSLVGPQPGRCSRAEGSRCATARRSEATRRGRSPSPRYLPSPWTRRSRPGSRS